MAEAHFIDGPTTHIHSSFCLGCHYSVRTQDTYRPRPNFPVVFILSGIPQLIASLLCIF